MERKLEFFSIIFTNIQTAYRTPAEFGVNYGYRVPKCEYTCMRAYKLKHASKTGKKDRTKKAETTTTTSIKSQLVGCRFRTAT